MRISHLSTLVFGTLWLVVAGFAGGGLWLRHALWLPEGPRHRNAAPVRSGGFSEEGWPGAEVWAGAEEAEGASWITRYELAGTFQVFDGEPEGVRSAALVDDAESGTQQIVREGDALGPFRVGSITEERMTLIRGERHWVLALSGEALLPERSADGEPAESEAIHPMDLPALETTRFGKRVKENYWILEKDAVKGYIDEMMQPQNMIRTAQLYRSFSQVAEREEDEPGFQIGMKAEQDFFRDMGLNDGDIIRRVNSMKMRSQQRAEYLLKEFYNDRMTAVVLDVERNGEIQQHIYLVR